MIAFAGTGRLVRLVVRRDRMRLSLWLVLLGVIIVSSAASLPPVYPDQADIDNYVELFGDNPALVAFAGPGYGFDDPNLGVILVNETQLWACVGVALMSIFLLTRHTRAEEDVERAEHIRSAPVGRHAPTAAAIVVVASANLALAVVCAAGFIALGYQVAGSLALAGSFVAVGWVFTGVTAVSAQLASSARGTLGLAAAVLGASFVLRAVGDIGDNALRWLSPIGWAQSVRAFAEEAWWALAACLVASIALLLVATWLTTHRDLGSGILPQRLGSPVASPGLRRPLGLAMRLQRGAVVGWLAGMFLTGVVYGSIGNDVEQMIEDNPTYADFLAQLEGASITDSFFTTSFTMLALLSGGFAISSALRLRAEEGAGRVEPLLAGSLSRTTWALSHLTITLVGTVLVVAAAGLGVGAAHAVTTGDAAQVPRLAGAALATVPGVLVLSAIAVLLFGWLPRAALATWAALGVAVVVGILGELLRLPDWSRSLSPFHHVPALPAEDVAWLPLALLLALAGAIAAAGLVGFSRRDLRTA
ncbi:MAG: ABC transporter permease [Acidimicrobiia bacterium]|nr:ABC transporter permease [Acidimicrobiia bacterium]